MAVACGWIEIEIWVTLVDALFRADAFCPCEYNPDLIGILKHIPRARAPPAIGGSVIAEPHAVMSVRLQDEVVDVYNSIVA